MYVRMSSATPKMISIASQFPLRPPGCHAITKARVVRYR